MVLSKVAFMKSFSLGNIYTSENSMAACVKATEKLSQTLNSIHV